MSKYYLIWQEGFTLSEWITGNFYLSQSQMENNAKLFYARMSGYGFSLNAIAAMLGNIQTESSINPGIWQNLRPLGKSGYGLVQWTPFTKYTEWAGAGWQDNGDKECERIAYEFDHGLQYAPTSSYPITAKDFKTSDKAPAYLATAFLYNYERPSNLNQPKRRTQAEYWYTFLSGMEPPQPEPPDPEHPDPEYPPEPEHTKMNAWLWSRFGTRFNRWGLIGAH